MLADALRRVLADTFVMYVHAHGAHWNITGDGFPQYHHFLNELYDELWEALDTVAEEMRAIGQRVRDHESVSEMGRAVG